MSSRQFSLVASWEVTASTNSGERALPPGNILVIIFVIDSRYVPFFFQFLLENLLTIANFQQLLDASSVSSSLREKFHFPIENKIVVLLNISFV